MSTLLCLLSVDFLLSSRRVSARLLSEEMSMYAVSFPKDGRHYLLRWPSVRLRASSLMFLFPVIVALRSSQFSSAVSEISTFLCPVFDESCLGLPGAVGAIAISRISTFLHAATMTLSSGSRFGDEQDPPQASNKLVMATLFLITIPVEVCFLLVLRSVGWLDLPIVFVALSLVFFGLAVSSICVHYS